MNKEDKEKHEEFEEIQRINGIIRKEIKDLLLTRFSTISDDYQDILEKIEFLILNEIEQEEFCNE